MSGMVQSALLSSDEMTKDGILILPENLRRGEKVKKYSLTSSGKSASSLHLARIFFW